VTVGIALGGGGVRGLAHLGVLRVFEREAIVPDVISGTSIGAVIGASYASGMPIDEMIEVALTLKWSELIRPAIRRHSVFDTAGLDELLETVIRARRFEHLRVPYAAVARDLATGERVVLDDGDPVRAARASSAIRRAFPPVGIGGRRLVDGTGVEALPVRAAYEIGADYVIAIDVLGAVATRRLERGRVGDAHPIADRYIRPELNVRSTWDFARAEAIVALGAAATERALPRIMADLAA
jgi:NTE family protein